MSALAVRVLSPIEVTVDGAPVDLGGALPRRLLTALVAAGGQAVPDDRLVEAVWGAAAPAKAAAALQVYVSRLRGVFGSAGRRVLETLDWSSSTVSATCSGGSGRTAPSSCS